MSSKRNSAQCSIMYARGYLYEIANTLTSCYYDGSEESVANGAIFFILITAKAVQLRHSRHAALQESIRLQAIKLKKQSPVYFTVYSVLLYIC